MPTRYITGASNAYVKRVAKAYDMGLMMTPRTAAIRKTKSKDGPAGTLGGYAIRRHCDYFDFLVLDNDAYGAKGKPFIETWWTWIKAAALLPEDIKERILFATAPDVLDWYPAFTKDGKPKFDKKGNREMFPVGRAAPTLELFREWAPKIKALGFPVALVAQDGLEDLLDEVDWDLVDWIFIGGSDDFKTGEGARLVTKRAKYEGKEVHMGRVSSMERMLLANSWDVDTADGTYLAYGPIENLPNVLEWIDATHDRPPIFPHYHRAVKERDEFRKATGKDPKTGRTPKVKKTKTTTRKAA